MLWIIIAIIVFLGLAIYVYRSWREDIKRHEDKETWSYYAAPTKGDLSFVLVMVAVGVGLGWFIVSLISTGIVWKISPSYETSRYPIVAVSDDTKTKGTFFLGSGSIDENPVYYYYGYDKYGNVARFWTEADRTGIKQDGEEFLEIISPAITNKWLQFGTFGEDRYVFHVPPGSVKQDFNFDNQ